MISNPSPLSTGWPDLDEIIKGVLPGDNIVWRVEHVEHYIQLSQPFGRNVRGRPLVYFRFADHPPLVREEQGAQWHRLNPHDGFAPFTRKVHEAIEQTGPGALFVFDLLSPLAEAWGSDALLANFFQLVCPHLYDLQTVAVFGLLRGPHAHEAVELITETAQVVLDVLQKGNRTFVRAVKTLYRYSPTITLLHEWTGDRFELVRQSAVAAEVTVHQDSDRLGAATRAASSTWNRASVGSARDPWRTLLSADDRLLELAHRYITESDLAAIRSRMIGTGRIGGKATGMLLGRAILKHRCPELAARLEPHDSFFVGADMFTTYLVHNGLWWMRDLSADLEHSLKTAALVRQRILSGSWMPSALDGFARLVDYFGQWPFIVRSSSVLEDGYGHAFAGKYDSLFCANQGPREQRMADVLAAARHIYASALSDRALQYRAVRGLLQRDEQMALLVMRVSGTLVGRRVFPAVAGVGFSFNPYAWHPEIDPRAGVVRLVLGLGTRAVNRVEDDYTRLVALNAPLRRPEANFEEIARASQRFADVVDLEANQVVSVPVQDLIRSQDPAIPWELLITESRAEANQPGSTVLTFNALCTQTPLADDLRRMLQTLEDAYENPVDIEFTVNFLGPKEYRIHLLQCRPLQVIQEGTQPIPWPDPTSPGCLAVAADAVIGHSRSLQLDWVVYIPPSRYASLTLSDRYAFAQWLGQLIRRIAHQPRPASRIAVLGPGRWGTTNPFLGIPVAFADIQPVAAIFELVAMHEHLIPDASLGTHFFSDLVENDMLYAALRPNREPNLLNHNLFEQLPHAIPDDVPERERWGDFVRVIAASSLPSPWDRIQLLGDAPHQRAGIFLA